MMTLLRILGFVVLGLLLVAAVAAGAMFLLRQLDLLPPESLTIAAGAPGTGYHDTALAYREVLARDDIELEILSTEGSVENAALLAREGGADIALVQGGVPLTEEARGLAAVFVEPLWVFARTDVPANPNDWQGLRVAAGAQGSGTRRVLESLRDITGAGGRDDNPVLEAGSAESAAALLAGEVDVALFVAPADARYLQPLFDAPQLHFLTLAHSEAIAERLPGGRLVRMPSGILDYRRPLPAEDTALVALVTRLVAREGLHPALVNRLIHAVIEVHRGREVIPANRHYPASRDMGVAADSYAAQLLDDGFSSLERLLPYWIVAQLNRVLLVLLPAILLLLPLLRLLPALYQALLRRRVFSHYKRVHEIDNRLLKEGAVLGSRELAALREELDGIEKQLLEANLPNAYRKQAYTLLHHLDFVRRRSDEIAQKRVGPAV
jgi:TRAP-type uncharacterized transport system substrate-binding protein